VAMEIDEVMLLRIWNMVMMMLWY